jgi:aryl-alcohol dehydrogenase-like predicted oxidoreductase
VSPWGALAEGKFKAALQGPSDQNEGRAPFLTMSSEKEKAVATTLQTVAETHNTTVTSIALAYLLHKGPHVFPVIGVRTVEQIEGNIQALQIALSDEEMEQIESAASFDFGYPHNWLGGTKGATRPEHVVQTMNQVICDYVGKPTVSFTRSYNPY